MPASNTIVAGFVAAASFVLAMNALPAKAQESAATVRTKMVGIHDLDLKTASDQAKLRHRLRLAASRVCTDGTPGDLTSPSYQACSEAAFDEAWRQAQTLIASAKARSLFAAGAAPAWTEASRLAAANIAR